MARWPFLFWYFFILVLNSNSKMIPVTLLHCFGTFHVNLVHIRLALQQWSLERSHAGGGRSVSEVVSLYVVGIRWPPITPTAQSVHSAPTQYAHASQHICSAIEFQRKNLHCRRSFCFQFFLEVDNRSLPNFNHMQMMILAAPRY